MLRHSLRACCIPEYEIPFFETGCVMQLFAQSWSGCVYRCQPLITAARHFNLTIPAGVHRALPDARLARQLLERFASLPLFAES